MIRKCLKPSELEKYGQLMDKTKSYKEWEELNYYTDNICFEISKCKNKCNNKICKELQNYIIELEDTDLIKDTYPDDDYFEINESDYHIDRMFGRIAYDN